MKLVDVWENNSEVAAVLASFGSTVHAEEVRQRLLREAGMLQCHVGSSQNL